MFGKKLPCLRIVEGDWLSNLSVTSINVMSVGGRGLTHRELVMQVASHARVRKEKRSKHPLFSHR